MIVLQILRLLFFAAVLPVCLGAGVTAFAEERERSIGFMWAAGQLVFMALFQILSVPVILLQEKVSFQPYGAFSVLAFFFTLTALTGSVAGIFLWRFRRGKERKASPGETAGTGGLKKMRCAAAAMNKKTLLLWAVFGAGLLAQFFLVFALAFSDGDDAYYTAVANVTVASDTMYQIAPYTGEWTGLDIRHCLAPFPILVAYLSKMSGFHPLVTANIAMPLLMLSLTYCVYGLIGRRLLREKDSPSSEKSWRFPVYMIFVEIGILWGNSSLYTAETFLMTRSRQGKAALANLIIPAVFLLMYMLAEGYSEERKGKGALWTLTAAAVTASCLCSTLGGFLLMVLLALFGICLLAVCRKWKLLPPLLLCMVPAVGYISLYLLLK